MQDITITIVGNLTKAPDLRFTPTGDRVCQVQIAQTPRVKRDGEWTDGETTYLWATAWGDLAEHMAESLEQGTRVIATGTLRTERWPDKTTGEKREAVKLQVEAIGPELRWATARVAKAARSHGAQESTPADAPF